MTDAAALPDFVAPMLSRRGAAFDSDKNLFEVKWDGTRALLFADRSGPRLRNRREAILDERYPELEGWRGVPAGAVLDGELVVLRDGVPDFSALLPREQIRRPERARAAARSLPATYVVFDLLYEEFEPIMGRPLSERRERLSNLIAPLELPALVLSEGIVGAGCSCFEKAVDAGLEGVMAKRLDSRYQPGARSEAWVKIKREEHRLCTVIGFTMRGNPLRSLVIGSEVAGVLRCVGKVGSGLTEDHRRALFARIPSIERDEPIVPCRHSARWVEPVLFCDVSYLEVTKSGDLRAPVLSAWLEGSPRRRPSGNCFRTGGARRRKLESSVGMSFPTAS